MEMIVRLSELKPGQEGIIKEFNSNEIFLKLMEMGCVPGERILMEQIAPLGRPDFCKCSRISSKSANK